MKEIKIVDLHGQHMKIKSELDQAIEEVIQESQFIRGRHVQEFQNNLENYLKVDHAITCGNGTDALQIALMALDLPKESEVIVPTFNYVAGAEVCTLLGLKPVFVEVDEQTFTTTDKLIEAKITDRTKAVIIVHLYGQCANMEPILQLCDSNDLYLIEDTAQALGAEYTFSNGTVRKAGTMGDIGTTSFFPTKCLGCMGDGGGIFTSDEGLAAKMRQIAFHGQATRYKYEIIGINSRLDTMQAAILDVKLKHLDEYISIRNKNANQYNASFGEIQGITTPYVHSSSTHVFHQYTIKVQTRNRIISKLESDNIPYQIYYPSPLHLEQAFNYLGYKRGDFPISEKLCDEIISLPIHTELTEDQLNYIADVVVN